MKRALNISLTPALMKYVYKRGDYMAALNDDGLIYLWSKIKAKITSALSGYLNETQSKELFATKDTATTTTAGLMSKADKAKLDGITTGANKYTHPTTSGNKHIPSGGSSGQILRWSADGTAVWGADNNTTYSDFKGSTLNSDGTHGLVPAPTRDQAGHILFGSGWDEIKMAALLYSTGELELGFYKGSDDDNLIGSTLISTATSKMPGIMSATDKAKLDAFSDASNYALKSDITNMYKYKGSLADVSKLPTSGQTVGDVYNIEAASIYGGAGMNVAWNGSAWDPLGEIFAIDYITNARIDEICV